MGKWNHIAPLWLLACMVHISAIPAGYSLHTSKVSPPAPAREFRGAWIATVANIDWPSRPGLTTAEQQAELIAILDNAQRLNLNAVMFQVRPACDALYESRLEPWSEYITGRAGEAPSPYYDPLRFAIEEAHRRGIELHAWFNPFRARHAEAISPPAENHLSKSRPELVRQYGRSLWLDPSERAVRDHSIEVITDVVRRYDIDGVHIDDYFYPYKEKSPAGRILDFPDEANWERYRSSGGRLTRSAWRRDQVNRFVERLYKAVKREKPYVKVGISPFGIWRPGYPATVRGFDAYEEIYADSRLWLNRGWVDYWTPQLYWKINQSGQSYPDLLNWWSGENLHSRHLWPGNYTSRVGDGTPTSWHADEIVRQIDATRRQVGAGGNVHFSMKALMQETELPRILEQSVYAVPALVPASPWLSKERPGKPRLTLDKAPDTGESQLSWTSAGGAPTWLWLVQTRRGTQWQTAIYPAQLTAKPVRELLAEAGTATVAITAVDRCGNTGPFEVVEISGPDAPGSLPDRHETERVDAPPLRGGPYLPAAGRKPDNPALPPRPAPLDGRKRGRPSSDGQP